MESIRSLVEGKLSTNEVLAALNDDQTLTVDALQEHIGQELVIASREINKLKTDPHKWMQYWLVQQTLLWALGTPHTASPSEVIERDAPRTHARVKQRDQTRTQEDL